MVHLEDPSINAIGNASAIDFVHIKENWDWNKPFSRYGFEFKYLNLSRYEKKEKIIYNVMF